MTNTLLSPAPSLHRSDGDISPAMAVLRRQQPSAPASTTKPQITQHDITVPVTPAVLKTTLAALAQPSLPIAEPRNDRDPAVGSPACCFPGEAFAAAPTVTIAVGSWWISGLHKPRTTPE